MKKILTIMMMSLTVLALWGQSSTSNSEPSKDSLNKTIIGRIEELDKSAINDTSYESLKTCLIKDLLNQDKDSINLQDYLTYFKDYGILKSQDEKDFNVPSILWILSAIGVLGFIIGIFSILIIRSRINIRINERKREIQDLEKNVSSFKEELRMLADKINVVSSKKSYVPQTSYLSESPNREKELDNVDNNTKLKPSPKRAIKNTPSGYNLYATVKVGSSFPEFFKVSREKTGDKVFMLMLAKEGDEIAEFTIVPDMTSDFMKSIISDRETYLPPVFCEKIIENQNPTKIEVKSKGRAKKESGRWTVQDRMSIKLV